MDVDIYGFMLAGALMTMGAIGDRIGRRRLLLIGAAAFGGGSVLAAFSSSAEMLIVMRGLLGLVSTAAATALFLRHVGIGGEPEQPPQRHAEAPPMTLAGHPVPTAE